MTESIIHPGPFPKYCCMFDVIVVKIDWNILSMSLPFIIMSDFSKSCETWSYLCFLSF